LLPTPPVTSPPEQLKPEKQLCDDPKDQKSGNSRATTEPGAEQVRGNGDRRVNDKTVRPGNHRWRFKKR